LDSQSYRRTEYLFEQEISRVERATREYQSRLDEIQRGIEESSYQELEPRRREFEQADKEFQKYYSGLETRYLTKRWQLIDEQRDIDRELERLHGIGSAKDNLRREYSSLEDKVAAAEREVNYEEERIDVEIKSCEEFESSFGENKKNLNESLNGLKRKLNENLNNLKRKNKVILTTQQKFSGQNLKDIDSYKIKKKAEYEAILKGNINKLLKELTIEMCNQEMNCPQELRQYLIYGDYSTVIQMEKTLLKNIERELRLLETELGRNGINKEWFLSKL